MSKQNMVKPISSSVGLLPHHRWSCSTPLAPPRQMWSPIIAAMSNSYRCYCIDTITEANKSVATKRIYSVADHVDWLRQVFAALDLASARVTGLSYGGWLAAQLALHAPERVSHLALLTPAGTLAPLHSLSSGGSR
jgi:pimeloyl-ACP methyl ester carboxylesterase